MSELDSYDWGPAFSPENFTQIPNTILLKVISGELIPTDLLAYGYLLAKARAMECAAGRDFTIVPETQMAADLRCSVSRVKDSISRLVEAGVLERKGTRLNSRTRILVLVENGRTVERPPRFLKIERIPAPEVVTRPASLAKQQPWPEPPTVDYEQGDDESPFG